MGKKYLNKTVNWNKLEGSKLMVVDVSAVMRTNQIYLDTPDNRLSGVYNPRTAKYKKPLYIELEDEIFNTSAMFGLLRIFKTFQLTNNVVFCFDSVKNLRKDIDKNYKGNRVKQGSEYYDQVNTLFKMFERSGFSALMIDGFEADDLVSHTVEKYVDDYDHIGVLTNDRDLTHLVRDNVYWLNVLRTKGDIHRYNYEEMQKIPYNTIILKKALVGDASDNFKGVKGFGDKSFDKLFLNELKGKEGYVYKNELDIIEKLNLSQDKINQAKASYNLAKPYDYLLKAKDVEFDVEADIKWNVFKLFLKKFQMKSILDYIESVGL